MYLSCKEAANLFLPCSFLLPHVRFEFRICGCVGPNRQETTNTRNYTQDSCRASLRWISRGPHETSASPTDYRYTKTCLSC